MQHVTVECGMIYLIKKRQASQHLTSQKALYEEVAQPKTSEQMFEMGDSVAYGPVRHYPFQQ